jgi:ABC-2 type transport system permease protein
MFGWVLPVFTYYFVGTSLGEQLVSESGVANYTSFFVIGLAFQGYVSNVIGTISQRIRNEQLYGTLEYYFLSPTGMFGLLVYSILWGFVLNTISVGATLAVGSGLGVKYTAAGLAGASLIVVLLLISSFGLAMISAGTVIVTKTGDPVSFFFTTFTALIAGAVFPITVFPYYLKLVAYAVPLTWALEGLRNALLLGYSLPQLSGIIGILVLFDLITVPLGYVIFVVCFNYSKQKGTLLEY